jgi:hypothetical protein
VLEEFIAVVIGGNVVDSRSASSHRRRIRGNRSEQRGGALRDGCVEFKGSHSPAVVTGEVQCAEDSHCRTWVLPLALVELNSWPEVMYPP